MSIDVKRRIAGSFFVALLVLAVYWPAPVLSINRACCGADLPIDDLSFLGREAPSWDIVFWCIAGIYLFAVLQSFDYEWGAFREPWEMIRGARVRRIRWRIIAAATTVALLATAATWRFLDDAVTAWAERVTSPAVEDVIRLFNRLGGGANPGLVVLFFVVVGVVSARRRWVATGVAMALAGLGAGIGAQLIKFAVARTRPELWLGPFVRAQHGATSFPSGHTIGSFALAGVLLFRPHNTWLRTAALFLACAVALSRILAFRHWASDVLASAILGVFAAYVAVAAVREERSE